MNIFVSDGTTDRKMPLQSFENLACGRNLVLQQYHLYSPAGSAVAPEFQLLLKFHCPKTVSMGNRDLSNPDSAVNECTRLKNIL